MRGLSAANLKIAKLRLSVNLPKIMFKLQNHFEYEAVTKEKTFYKFKVIFAVPFYIFLFRIITSCNGHFPAMDA
jgi:hypothetical protein